MTSKITIRKYQPGDAKALAEIYYHTIHTINTRDYSDEQINVWAAAASLNPENWLQKWEKLSPFVAVIDQTIVGFAEFEENGHIDCFYVHHEYQNHGVGSALMAAIEKAAQREGIIRIYAEVSITAKPFFAKKGFKVVKEQQVILRNIALTNFVMDKWLVHAPLSIRQMTKKDIPVIVSSFQKIQWASKTTELFTCYLEEQQQNERLVWVAYVGEHFAGYVTLKWQSQYLNFSSKIIPEIMDLNVLPKFRKLGVGNALMDTAEQAAAKHFKIVGIGVGLTEDYGAAQRLYAQRGFLPDGRGLTYRCNPINPGQSYPMDDDLILWFTKATN